MERLTTKLEHPTTKATGYELYVYDGVVALKLGKLEDLEEEIGCPLEVRCKLYNTATVYGINGKERVIACWKDRFITVLCVNNMKIIHKYSEFKETWWLKEDKE